MLSPTKTILAVSFLDMLSIGLIIPQLQHHALALGCNHLLIGAMGAAYSATQLISGPMIGSLSDIKGRKPILLFTLILCGVAYSLLGITKSIIMFFLLRSFLGIFKQTQLLTKSIAPDYTHSRDEHSAAFGKLTTLAGIGMSLGPVAGGHIMEMYPDTGFTIISFLVTGMFAINACLVKLLPNTSVNNNNISREKKNTADAIVPYLLKLVKRTFKESIDDLKKIDWPVYWDVFLYKLIITLCMGMYFSNYSIFLKTKHQVSPKYLGYIIAFQGAIGSFCTYFIEYFNKYYKDDVDASKRTLHMFITITFSFIAMGLAPSIYLYILFVVPLAVSGAIGRVAGLEMIINKGHDEHRGSVIGATSSVRSLSGVVTPVLVGGISQYIGINYVIFFAALFSAAGIAVSYKIRSQSVMQGKSKSD